MSDRLTSRINHQGDWHRWEMDELNAPQQEHRARERNQARQEAIRRQALQRNAELETLRENARKEAYDAAYQEGLEQGHREGYEQGLSEGRLAGEQELQQQIQQTLQPLLPLAERFHEALDSLDAEIAERLVDLALTTGRRLAGEALEARPEEIQHIVRELLHAEPALSGNPRLWLHPADLTLVKAHLGTELEAAGWKLQPDEQVQRGGCRATSASGELDASLESRWEAITARVRRRNDTPGTVDPRGET